MFKRFYISIVFFFFFFAKTEPHRVTRSRRPPYVFIIAKINRFQRTEKKNIDTKFDIFRPKIKFKVTKLT
jgi:hypothetical protein